MSAVEEVSGRRVLEKDVRRKRGRSGRIDLGKARKKVE